MTGPSGNRLSVCPLRLRIASPRVPIDLSCTSVIRKVIHASLPSHSTILFVFKIIHTSVTVIIVHYWQGVVSREPTAVTMLYLRYQCDIRVTVNILLFS